MREINEQFCSMETRLIVVPKSEIITGTSTSVEQNTAESKNAVSISSAVRNAVSFHSEYSK